MRCLACVGIVLFHLAWYAGLAADDKIAADGTLARQTWLTVILNPELSMQTFMCLTRYEYTSVTEALAVPPMVGFY